MQKSYQKKPHPKPRTKHFKIMAFISWTIIWYKLTLTYTGDDSSVAVTDFTNADTIMNSKNKNTHQRQLFILSHDKV